MGFPKTVTIEALTAAARHCCVCHRYRGLKIEVHHIIPESEGGSNILDNAIALCFDCHTDAGHYNDNHPRGTKFSRPELRKARAEWYDIVKKHNILAQDSNSDHLHFRHIILRQYKTAKEIFDGDLKEFPFNDTLLFQNEIGKFVKEFIVENHTLFSDGSVEVRIFKTIQEIFSAYPDYKLIDKSDPDFPYHFAIRVPKLAELKLARLKVEPYIRHLIDNDIDPVLYCRSLINEQKGTGCGDFDGLVTYPEYFVFRPLWFTFLTVTNTSSSAVEILTLEGKLQQSTYVVGNVLDVSGLSEFNLNFPKVKILPNQTILIPTGMVLPPFEQKESTETIIFNDNMKDERDQVLWHIIDDIHNEDYFFIGKYFIPKSVTYNPLNRILHSEMHELDFKNFFILDRYWGIGSCPHLFYKHTNSKHYYISELFTRFPGIDALETLVIPKDVVSFVIAELEDEITYINRIEINNILVRENIVLNKLDTIELSVNEGDEINLIGHYKPLSSRLDNDDRFRRRNSIIGKYLHTQNIGFK